MGNINYIANFIKKLFLNFKSCFKSKDYLNHKCNL